MFNDKFDIEIKHCDVCISSEYKDLSMCGDNCSSKFMLRRFREIVGSGKE